MERESRMVVARDLEKAGWGFFNEYKVTYKLKIMQGK